MLYKYRWILIILYVIFGLYFLNYPLNFIQIPAAISSANNWIIFVGGILIILGGISYFKTSRYAPY